MYISDLGHLGVQALALLIPTVAIIAIFASKMFAAYHRTLRQREMFQLYHTERMAAIEKGMELPPLPAELLHDRYEDAYWGPGFRYRSPYRGVMTVLVGVAITLALWQTGGNGFWWGLIIVAVGLGQLVISALERNSRNAHPSAIPPQGGPTGNSSHPDRG